MRGFSFMVEMVMRFFNQDNKLNFNSDETAITWMGTKTKNYERGVRRLNKRARRLGGLYNIELGYDRKKLD
jgi:hypothetical protein